MDEIPIASEFSRKRWWWVLRRAYAIPDIVSDENATSYLVQMVNGLTEIRSFDMDDPNDGATITVGLVLDLGDEGSLDILVLNKDVGEGDICISGATRLLASDLHQRIAAKLGSKVIAKVCEYVRLHPREVERQVATMESNSDIGEVEAESP